MSRYPKWKVDLFLSRTAQRCCCRLSIPGVIPDRNHPDCPLHGRKTQAKTKRGTDA